MVQALGIARAVRISEQLVVHPGQVLLRCVAATVRYLITILAFDGKVRLLSGALGQGGYCAHFVCLLELEMFLRTRWAAVYMWRGFVV